MYHPAKRIVFTLLSIALLLASLSSCNSTSPIKLIPTPTPNPYSLSGGGSCVKLSTHPQPPYTNIQVSHDTYLDHSEPMLAEEPTNPLHLVGGSKFFTDPAHYRFQIGYFASFDGGCTWTDGGVLPGFDKNATTSDISFAFDIHNHVYAAVLFSGPKKVSGIAVSTSTDGGKTFGSPVIVYHNQDYQVFSDKPWIVVDQTKGAPAFRISLRLPFQACKPVRVKHFSKCSRLTF